MPLLIGRGDQAKRRLLADYVITPLGHSAAPASQAIVCCCGEPIAQGHPFHLFRAMPRRQGLRPALCYATAGCAGRLSSLHGSPLVLAGFTDPLDVLAIDKFRLLRCGNDSDGERLSPLNREARTVLTLLMQWVAPAPGSVTEALALRLQRQPANDLDAWDLRALNMLVNRQAASVGGTLQGIVSGLARRYRLEHLPQNPPCPRIRRALSQVQARSYL